jgi:hypothetical protein
MGADKIQLIIVESGVVEKIDDVFLNSFGDVKRILVPAEGVYSAYNHGIDAADGLYIMFFGVDDIALPGMDRIISVLENDGGKSCIVAAGCYMEATGLRLPSSCRYSLIIANWCHQGILYLRSHLLNNRYDLRYKVQADHKLNIDIVANRSLAITVSKEVVAYFSSGGISSTVPDIEFRKDFPSIVACAYGLHWGLLVKAKQIIVDLFLGPPSERFRQR